MRVSSFGTLTLAALASFAAPAAAQDRLSLRTSFPIGSGGDAICSGQTLATDPALSNMFDRGYSITCRDAAAPVGQVFALRMRGRDPAADLATLRGRKAQCRPGAEKSVDGIGTVQTLDCRLSNQDLGYRVISFTKGGTYYVAEGLAGYESALELGLRSVAANRIVDGEVSVATTGAGDATAFARVQAGNLGREQALAEAYRRNNSGAYAEAAEFFGSSLAGSTGAVRAEALVNQALQMSNLGSYGDADVLFDEASRSVDEDAVVSRQLRNYRAMHLLNQGRMADALDILDRPIEDVVTESDRRVQELVIDGAIAAELSSETAAARRLGGREGLSPADKAQILDAQAMQLRGSMLKLQGRSAEAEAALRSADRQLVAVRNGRVSASIWMRAQIFAELADLAEGRGDLGGAEALHQSAIDLVKTNYPGSPALISAKGRLAFFQSRTGRRDAALAGYKEIVEESAASATTAPALRGILASYFRLLTEPSAPTEAAADMFRASQLLVRPGVAQTQAVLARELSGGSDEAARLFRQATNLSRDVERLTVEVSRLQAQADDPSRLDQAVKDLERAKEEQAATQSRLAQYPRYRAVSTGVLEASDLQKLLKAGEAYYKMIVIGADTYALFVAPGDLQAFRLGVTAADLDQSVNNLRETISTTVDGQQTTIPYDIELAHRLYGHLFAPVASKLSGVNHLVFEPDGAMLRLPPNILVMDQDSVAAYRAAASGPNGDDFDFRGVKWLGRDRDISTAVSARAFSDVRRAPPSRAASQYIGFGQNAPVTVAAPSGTRGATGTSDRCEWPLAVWDQPISGDELVRARTVFARGGDQGAQVVTGAAFNDTALAARTDLSSYRIIHFATHGLLVPPRADCPTRPALLTSFGAGESDGLLTFREIFDLRFDADIVILSACDTAGQASMTATREAGLRGGGDVAFDGLVRAFVGAGARLVVASHWAVPDSFNATERLISGLFAAPAGAATASALRTAQHGLMDSAETSHPFYWGAFAVIGDGQTPVIRAAATQTASLD